MIIGIITPSLAAVAVLLILVYLVLIRPLCFAPLSHVPGPIGCKLSWYYILFSDIRLERNDKIAKWHQIYGPVICIRPGEVSFSCPVLMREIYGTSGKYTKSDFFDNFITYGEKSLFSIGPYWEHQRKRMLISSFYHKTNINQPLIEQFVRRQMVKLFRQIESKMPADMPVRSFNVYPIFNCFAFDNISRLLFGPRHCSHTIENDGEERRLLLGMKQAQVWGPLKFGFPLLVQFPCLTRYILPGGFQDSLTAEHKLAVWSWDRLTAAIEDKEMEADFTLLRRMMTVKDKDGEPLERNYIASEMFDHLNAAQETVAVALTYVAYHLSIQPEWQRRIRDELRALPVQEDGFPSFADVDGAPLLEAFVREVHRVNPGASGRQERIIPEGGKEYNGIFLPHGIRASASTIALHNNPAVFPAPHVFDPKRWLGLTPEQLQYLERSFIPFGYGARMCLGKAFATLELKLLTASLYLRYSTEVDPDSATTPETMWQTGTMDSVPSGLRCDLLLRPVT